MVQVKISDGILEGKTVTNEISGTYYSFKGIPYAAPPVGDLRFKAPQPPIPWQGVRSALEHGRVCIQYNFVSRVRVENGSEDCLFLNVYTPDICPPQPFPVMFFIHGGAFSSGSGDDDIYGPDFLIRNGVILVTINYRLEVLGFLCLDTEEAPGNAGLKDQVAALRWVHKNISQFGGDPNNVTIFGQSSGAACVTLHCVSPMTKGLFKRAIAQSGCMLNSWCFSYRPRDRALALAKKLGCASEDDKELYEFFKNQPMENLCEIQEPITLKENQTASYETQFCTVIEKKFPNVEAYLTGDILEELQNHFHEGVALIIGYNEDDGIVKISASRDLNRTLHNANFFKEYFCPTSLSYYLSIDDQLEIGSKMRSYYIKNQVITTKNLHLLAKYWTAESYKFGIWEFAKYFSAKNKVFVYKFKCKSERNFFCTIFGMSAYFKSGSVVCHNDEIAYLFPIKSIKQKLALTSPTFKLINAVTKLWTNFAKTGNLTDASLGVTWRQYTAHSQNYLEIGNRLVRGTSLDHEEQQFWIEIFRKYSPNGINGRIINSKY